MPHTDLPLDQLRRYRTDASEPDDFDDFWTRTVAEARAAKWDAILAPVSCGLTEVDAFDVTFSGFAGDQIKAWFLVPRTARGPLPVVVTFVGYHGGRALPHEHLAWVAAGYACFVMDTRGQGSAWGSGGDTADPHGAGPAAPGFVTRGIESPEAYYYRRVFADAVRAVDTVREFAGVDPTRVVAHGASQGGAIALAVAGLVDDLCAVMPDVPFLSDIPRAIELADRDPYAEIVRYLSVHRDRTASVLRTLSYFDGVNFARRARAAALYSVALRDPVCPPSTVFASANEYAAPVAVEIYPYNEHEGGGGHHWLRQVAWLAPHAGR